MPTYALLHTGGNLHTAPHSLEPAKRNSWFFLHMKETFEIYFEDEQMLLGPSMASRLYYLLANENQIRKNPGKNFTKTCFLTTLFAKFEILC